MGSGFIWIVPLVLSTVHDCFAVACCQTVSPNGLPPCGLRRNAFKVRELSVGVTARDSGGSWKERRVMKSTLRVIFQTLLVSWWAGVPILSMAAPPSQGEADLAALVHADWEAQEKRVGRDPQSAEAVQAALQRAGLLLDDLAAMNRSIDFSVEAAELERYA